MRKTSKARDHVLVLVGIVERAIEKRLGFGIRRIAQRREQRHAARLHGAIFGVLQRQVAEDARHRRHGLIVPALDAFHGQRQRLCIGGKAGGLAAKHVARELVEHDQQR